MTQGKNKSNINRYNQKAKSSFKARFDLLLYERITNEVYEEITTEELEEFEIIHHKKLLNEYIHVYWQQASIKDSVIRGKTIDQIYLEMKAWREHHKSNIDNLLKHYIDNIYDTVFPKAEFFQMVENAEKCEYCHITTEQINELIEKQKLFKKHITRGWSFEIDRKEANLEYTKGNCVICCYWCNNAKTDEFSFDEFKNIGIEIQKIWHGRLKGKMEHNSRLG